jgi:hypothetical protein
MSDIEGFSTNDFFFVKAENDYTLDDKSCASVKKTTCFAGDTRQECIQQALCTNKQKANVLYSITQTTTGEDQKYLDTKMSYDDSLLNCINLGLGIVFLSGFIYSTYIYNS